MLGDETDSVVDDVPYRVKAAHDSYAGKEENEIRIVISRLSKKK